MWEKVLWVVDCLDLLHWQSTWHSLPKVVPLEAALGLAGSWIA